MQMEVRSCHFRSRTRNDRFTGGFFVCFSEPLNWQAEDVRLTNLRFFLQKPGKMDIIRRKWERGFKETEAKVACISAVT